MIPLADATDTVISTFTTIFIGLAFAEIFFDTKIIQSIAKVIERMAHRPRPVSAYVRCPRCHGTGRYEGQPRIGCGHCAGRGHLGPAPRKRRSLFSWFVKEKR